MLVYSFSKLLVKPTEGCLCILRCKQLRFSYAVMWNLVFTNLLWIDKHFDKLSGTIIYIYWYIARQTTLVRSPSLFMKTSSLLLRFDKPPSRDKCLFNNLCIKSFELTPMNFSIQSVHSGELVETFFLFYSCQAGLVKSLVIQLPRPFLERALRQAQRDKCFLQETVVTDWACRSFFLCYSCQTMSLSKSAIVHENSWHVFQLQTRFDKAQRDKRLSIWELSVSKTRPRVRLSLSKSPR
jgi:hypothetical protein